ncbi:CASC3/Barentsz elF4AIII-binding protein [Hibiscus trionum]|uniref:CASC3/Barentsz elF4AIII-binding protein n=1 Tax=Hibiscus trionum TaxID=183268 RepID=A0A9W7HR52_HIBTR|nr:CASC3/Barentsz elF4AIII-binding protein [Hibiscus trionum]
MATTGGEEVEYESDPEEAKRSLALRRREAASDDEEGEREDANNTEPMVDRRDVIHSDESDGQGGAADYDDDDEELDLEEDEEVEEVYDEEDEEFDDEEVDEVRKGELQEIVEKTGEDVKEEEEEAAANGNRNVDEGVEINNNDNNHVGEEGEEGEEEEKKENEPFAVPTAGAFYMHDDRFRDNVGARHRRTHGGRKLWESKDDGKWGHDKFEEINLQEKHYEHGERSSRGRYRARSKNKDPDSGYPRGSRPKAFGKSNNQNHASKAVRGRGPIRYEPTMRNSSQAPPAQNKLSGKPRERTAQANSSRAFIPETNADTASAPARKHIVESSLSSASPPFYPSGSSNKDITSTQEKDMQAGSISRKLHPSVTDKNFSVSQSNSLHGKNVLDSLSMAKLYIDDSSMSASVKPLTNLQLGNTGQPSHSRVQGRGVAIPGQKAYQPAPHQNQVNRDSPPTQVNSVQRSSVQGRALSSVQEAAKQLGQHPSIGSQASSPPKTAMSFSSYESGEVESSETSNSKGALVSKGKSSAQGAGRGTFLYGGAQIMGATGSISVSHGDQNFPAFLPVMQFGGQHPGGLSVPAVGMAFPGYVAQPQLGRGNSEMTWLPVLTGAAGALGATYCPPYIAVDGSYHSRPSGQISSTGSSSKENTSNKPNNEWKPSQRNELVSDEFGQRQNNPNKQPRRYSEMSFSK